ncbi:hypothetical protein R6U76_14715 [Lysinibacillus capsici]|uniref:hypothetical protein n=1 Tax=Lysinibacillus capsici TaxID=2115968 RepID=UPI0029DE89FC|nr:hypothetical protein [Lysinibacillus capsici]WPK03930.1 hypothetical protein R6U76_14715 [Lysinibacillus capsici]
MTIELGSIDLNDLERTEVFGIPFGYKVTENEGNTKNLVIMPSPDEVEDFNAGLKYFNYETLILLRSKYFFGINHRVQMFEVLYNTFVEIFEKKEENNLNDILTLQAVYSDMIIKLGTVLEDFAGMCYACKEYQQDRSDIAQVFLAYSDPISFYRAIIAKSGKRQIKQIFCLPQSKGELHKIYKNLTNDETDLLMKAIQKSTSFIYDKFCDISTSILRITKEDVTYYDMYNKLKHGFSPFYPFTTSMPLPINGVPNDVSIKEIIIKYFFENLTIMHDKLPGQRTVQEQQQYEEKKLATPTFTYQDINLESAMDIKKIISDITLIYRHLIKKYLLLSKGKNSMILLMPQDYLTVEEKEQIESIINDKYLDSI